MVESGSGVVVLLLYDGTVVYGCYFSEVKLEGWWFEGNVCLAEEVGYGNNLASVCGICVGNQ